MRQFLHSLFHGQARRRSPRPYRRPLVVEGLEARTLLSITLPPAGHPGPAVMTGTPGNDIFVIRDTALLTNQGQLLQFSDDGGKTWQGVGIDDVTSITVHGMGGQDRLVLNEQAGLIAKAGGLSITFDGSGNANTLIIRGSYPPAPHAHPQPITSPYAETDSLTTGGVSITTTNGTLSQTINFTSAAKIVDTLAANSLTVNVHGLSSDHISLYSSSPFDGFATNRIDASTSGPPHSGTFSRLLPSIVFAEKASVQVDAQDSNDTFMLNIGQPATGMRTLTLTGGGGTNTAYVYAMPSRVRVHFVHIQHIVYENPPPPRPASSAVPFGVPNDPVEPAVKAV